MNVKNGLIPGISGLVALFLCLLIDFSKKNFGAEITVDFLKIILSVSVAINIAVFFSKNNKKIFKGKG